MFIIINAKKQFFKRYLKRFYKQNILCGISERENDKLLFLCSMFNDNTLT